jgi:hypothetical protein
VAILTGKNDVRQSTREKASLFILGIVEAATFLISGRIQPDVREFADCIWTTVGWNKAASLSQGGKLGAMIRCFTPRTCDNAQRVRK